MALNGRSSIGFNRLINELKMIQKNSFGAKVCTSDDFFEWNVLLSDITESPYEGFQFELQITFKETYPFEAPNVKFLTPIEHLNVDNSGYICLNILNEAWSPIMCVENLIMCIIVLMKDPNINDPLNTHLAELFKNDRPQYYKTIVKHCKRHVKFVNADKYMSD